MWSGRDPSAAHGIAACSAARLQHALQRGHYLKLRPLLKYTSSAQRVLEYRSVSLCSKLGRLRVNVSCGRWISMTFATCVGDSCQAAAHDCTCVAPYADLLLHGCLEQHNANALDRIRQWHCSMQVQGLMSAHVLCCHATSGSWSLRRAQAKALACLWGWRNSAADYDPPQAGWTD